LVRVHRRRSCGRWRVVGHDRGLALDRLAGAEADVGPAQFVLDGLGILLGPAVQPVQADDPGQVVGQRPKRDDLGAGPGGGGRDGAISDLPAGAEDLTGHIGRGVPGLTVTGVVRKQRPVVVGRGQRLVSVPRRRQGGDVIPHRPTLRTADKRSV